MPGRDGILQASLPVGRDVAPTGGVYAAEFLKEGGVSVEGFELGDEHRPFGLASGPELGHDVLESTH